MDHQITRHRHELRRRRLTVAQATHITPDMIRLVFDGEDLADFVSLGFDDHVKIFVPGTGAEPERRDYTPRAFDAAARRLTLDFAVHDAGPATRWAIGARPGDTLDIGGLRGSMVVSPTFDWWLLAGDETALPAMGRCLEELPAKTRVITAGVVTGPAEEQVFRTAASHQALWVHRPLTRGDDPAPLLGALRGLTLPPGDGFVWIAAEAGVARAARDHFLAERGHPKGWLKAAGYWVKGVADANEKLQD